jgi:hypothetical protein
MLAWGFGLKFSQDLMQELILVMDLRRQAITPPRILIFPRRFN